MNKNRKLRQNFQDNILVTLGVITIILFISKHIYFHNLDYGLVTAPIWFPATLGIFNSFLNLVRRS